MTPERHAQIAALFAEARRLGPVEQAALLDTQASGDAELRREVEALLAHDARPRINIDDGALEALGSSAIAEVREAAVQQAPTIPGFAVGAMLGQGGMGVVYRATQERPRREVALKLVRFGLHDPRVLRRFEHEAALLARLEHPHIARVYAFGVVGSEGSGQPYYAMELVEGVPFSAGLDGLDRAARLALFAKICAAVHYAHSKGVVHRDLKPSNILVTSDGMPKILDFGIGKLVDDADEDSSQVTLTGQVLGTPAYMSPEQALGDSNRVDTRSDVYALGVILFEVISGRLPHDVREQPVPRALRTIAEQPPARLSRFGAFPRDLEVIVDKALRTEPEQRYQSAAALADDVLRFLRREPIEAREATLGYQLRCLAARHRAAFVATLVAAAALVIGAVGLVWGLRDAIQARGLAETRLEQALAAERLAAERLEESEAAREESARQTRIATAVNAFFNEDLLRQIDPTVGRHDITLREALDAARERLGTRFADEPLVRASILYTLGDAYLTLARYDEAEVLLDESFALRKAGLPRLDDDVMAAESSLVIVYTRQGALAKSIALSEEMLAARRDAFGPDSPETMAMMNNLAMLQMDVGNLVEAVALSETVVETMRRVAPDNAETLASMINLQNLYARVDRIEDAIALLADCDAMAARVLPAEHPYRGYIWNALGTRYLASERYADAVEEYARAIALRTRLVGEEHPNTLNARANLAVAKTRLGQFEEAEAIFLDVLDLFEAQLGARHARVLAQQANLLSLYRQSGDWDAGSVLGESLLEVRSEESGAAHPDTLLAAGMVGAIRIGRGDVQEGVALLRETVAVQQDVLGVAHRETVGTQIELAAGLNALESFEAAREVVAEALDVIDADAVGRLGQRVRLLQMDAAALCGLGQVALGRARLTEAEALCDGASLPACRGAVTVGVCEE